MSKAKSAFTPGVIAFMLFSLIVIPLLPILVSGDWSWPEAWIYLVLVVGGTILSRGLMARKHPDLLQERARFMRQPDTKPWDRVLAPSLMVGWILTSIVAGLDHRFGWAAAFPVWVKIAAVLGIIFGSVLSSWALLENRFFSGVVRIQTERGHHVVSTGPYRFIRHPGYAGGLLAFLLVPVLLNSTWALIPTVLFSAALVLRTALEDKTLQNELSGYKEYTQRTRYRLVPGIW